MTGHPLAIAHRGACDYAPENTLKAFRIAADLCAEMWELDIRLSADGVCVVTHDDNLTRVARRGLRVSQATWREISALRLPEDQHIPRLEQVIELVKKCGCGLHIEIKSEGAGPLAWKLLQDAGFRFAALASFNVVWIRELRDLGCQYPLGVMVPTGAEPFAYLDGVQVEIIHPCWRDASDSPDKLLTGGLLQKFVDRRYQVVIWHEDRAGVLDGLWDQPIMGLCSDRPELLKPYRPDPRHPVDIVCHRGANTLAPENTLEAARICADQRFQYVELDVRTTADGELVVIHDARLGRTTNGSGLVVDTALAEIKTLDAGGWFRAGSAGYRVPTLDQMLELLKGHAGLYIEVKHADAAALLRVVKAHDMLDMCYFWGYDTAVMRDIRALSADAIMMAPRWMYNSVKEATMAYGAQIVEFDVLKDDLSEISQCNDLGVRSMIYSQTQDLVALSYYLDLRPDMVNLDRPDRFKILACYPGVRRHFQAVQDKCGHG
jgi:glycerophosphoryl diester phosphodiesterase